MVNEDRIKANKLGLVELQRHPVWTWCSDLEHPEDSLIPVELTEKGIAEVDCLLVYAVFTTAAGNEHEGLIVFDPWSEEVYAIELIFPSEKITMNCRLPEFVAKMLERYTIATGSEASGVLPIRYRAVCDKLSISPGEFTF